MGRCAPEPSVYTIRPNQLLAISLPFPVLAGDPVLSEERQIRVLEICRQTLRFLPGRLILLEQAEGALFEVDQELRQRWLGADLVPYVADISDKRRIARVFNAERPQVIFHCAAHKHVPMMEINPGEAIKNNIFGTKTVADAAVACGAAAFIWCEKTSPKGVA